MFDWQFVFGAVAIDKNWNILELWNFAQINNNYICNTVQLSTWAISFSSSSHLISSDLI